MYYMCVIDRSCKIEQQKENRYEKMQKWLLEIIKDKKILLDEIGTNGYLKELQLIGSVMIQTLVNERKILLAGNGGSAADAQHFAGEMVGRFLHENRKALPAISLCVDSSVTTCIANDFGFENIFARQIEGLGQQGDVFVAISTSGNSENLIRALSVAKGKNMVTIGLLGKNGGRMMECCDYSLVVPSNETPRIQEIHTFSVHLLCEYIERTMFEC